MKQMLQVLPFVVTVGLVGTAQSAPTAVVQSPNTTPTTAQSPSSATTQVESKTFQTPTELGAGLSLSGNTSIATDYRYRGYSYTDFRPAVQLGLDLKHSSGLYLSNSNTNVSKTAYSGANLKMSFYGGWQGELGNGLGLDVGAAHQYFPRSHSPEGGNYNNTDLYVGANLGNFSVKYTYTPGDFYSHPHTHGTWYVEGAAKCELGDGWGLMGHVGYQKLKGLSDANGDPIHHYVDYKVGLSKDYKGWIIEAAAVGTSKADWFRTVYGTNAGRWGAVFSVARNF